MPSSNFNAISLMALIELYRSSVVEKVTWNSDTHMQPDTHSHMNVHPHVGAYSSPCVYTHAHAHTHTHTQTHTHMNMHTHIFHSRAAIAAQWLRRALHTHMINWMKHFINYTQLVNYGKNSLKYVIVFLCLSPQYCQVYSITHRCWPYQPNETRY